MLPGENPVSLPRQPRAGKETILLVEDEPSLRKLAVLSLQGAGYKVLEAAHGGEARRWQPNTRFRSA